MDRLEAIPDGLFKYDFAEIPDSASVVREQPRTQYVNTV